MFKIPTFQLYLFQLEGYELKRYLKLLWNKGLFPKTGQRKNLVWTPKARAFFTGALTLHFAVSFLFFYFLTQGLSVFSIQYYVLSLGLFATLYTLYFILYTFFWFLLWPVELLAKRILVLRAKLLINNHKTSIRIIGIAGSYGKTTMKEVLKQVLSTQYLVLSTPESVNTPIGISRFILNKVSNETQILIIEMGEHYKGDIKEICELTQPDLVVVTGINEAHMERMGTKQAVVETIFEAAQNSKENAGVFINGDDENVVNNYQKFVLPNQKIEKYSGSSVKRPVFNTNALQWEGEHEAIGKFKVKLLGEYVLGNVDCAIKVAELFGLQKNNILDGLESIRPVEHRLQPGFSPGGILVIDDAYNGNSNGVKEAIKVLAQFKNRRKIYITPGLVETGAVAKELHLDIGRQLASVANVVILIRNSVTKDIELGIRNYGSGSKPEILWYETAPEAHAALKDILKPNDVILFQNDWGDQYL